jgi:YgiT-type zinc finger domain-containing protein
MTEQCAFCGNKHLTPKTTRYLHQHDEQLLIVEGVPCLECDFCGEQYFEIDVLKRIEADHQEIAEHRREPARYVSVAVEAFDSVR